MEIEARSKHRLDHGQTHGPTIDNLEISEINIKSSNHLDSIFCALDSPR